MGMTKEEFNNYLWKMSVNDPQDGKFYLYRDTVVDQVGLKIFSEDQNKHLMFILKKLNEPEMDRVEVNAFSI